MPTRLADSERILVLTPLGRDASLATELLRRGGFVGHICANGYELAEEIKEGAGIALVGEEALDARVIDAFREVLETQPAWSDFPFIVFAHRVTDKPSSHVEALLQLANVTLLDRPVRGRILLSAVRSALRGRRRQYDAKRAIIQRDNFLAMLGHELRNPINAIGLSNQLLSSRLPEHAGSRRQVEIIGRQVTHLARLVDDLLDVARVTSGKVLLHREVLDLGRLIASALEMQDGRARVDVTLPAHPIKVSGDPVRLEQIVVNLLGNAVKYTPEPGRVKISLEANSETATMRVTDEGIGIAAEMLPQVFELFSQIDGTLDRARGGLGIGLTVVKGLVDLHGGSIQASSAGLGRGSAFTVQLPLAEEEAVHVPMRSEKHKVLPRKVLVIEDSPDIRDSLTEILESEGHQVFSAGDGVDGLRAVVERQPDVALVDIGLPGMDGYSVARAVRRDVGRKVRLIALSGYGQPSDKKLARDAGFDAHVTKPVNLDALLEMVESQGML